MIYLILSGFYLIKSMADVLDIDNAEEFDVDEGDGEFTFNKN